MAKVFTMDHYSVETFEPIPYFIDIDGDQKRICIADNTPDGGTLITTGGYASGRPLTGDFIPRRVRRLGAGLSVYPKLDCHDYVGRFLVTEKVRHIIEAIEPGVHQFFPISVSIGKDDTPYGSYFLFHCCQRIDGLDPVLAQPRNNRGCLARRPDGSRAIILSRNTIAPYHVWHERYCSLGINGAFMSDRLAQAMINAEVTGLRLNPVAEA